MSKEESTKRGNTNEANRGQHLRGSNTTVKPFGPQFGLIQSYCAALNRQTTQIVSTPHIRELTYYNEIT